jgi:glycosyltransferase involved in cell wall biosynthesis
VRSPLPEWFIDVGKHIHLTCFSNINDVIEARSRGIKSDYLQIGVPNKIFVPEGEISNKTTDIVFMGNNVGGFPLSKMRSDMVYLLKSRYGEKFKSFGIGFGEQITNQQEEASIYRGAKMAISLSHFNYTNYYSDRLLRIMGSGCLALSYNFEGITDEFTPNEHLLVWDNFENLVYLIDEFLNKNHDRKVIAKAGCEHVHEKHTWDNRIDQLIKLL